MVPSKKSSRIKTRKELRKEQRKMKKVKRNEYYLNKKNNSCNKLNEKDEAIQTKPGKKSRKKLAEKEKEIEVPVKLSVSDQLFKEKRKEDRKMNKLFKEMRQERVKQLELAGADDDKAIRSLEKKLKINKRKTETLPKSFAEDGLDYILNYLDDVPLLKQELEEHGDEFGDDISRVIGNPDGSNKKSNMKKDIHEHNEDNDDDHNDEMISDNIGSDSDDQSDDGIDSECLENEADIMSTDENDVEDLENENDFDDEDVGSTDDNENDIDDEELDYDSEQNNQDSENETEIDELNENVKKEPEMKQNIYGQFVDEKGNVIQLKSSVGAYVPPQKRVQMLSASQDGNEQITRITRHLKGPHNRLSSTNMHIAVNTVEDMYNQYSRHDVNFVLLKLMKDALLVSELCIDQVVLDNVLLISVIHANIGSEVGAFLLQNFVEYFIKLMDEDCTDDKKLDNLTLVLCHMYNFKIFHACLMYDLLKKLMSKFEEKHVELILLILRTVGFVLRKDDPVQLKEFILNIQTKTNECPDLRQNNRVRFMLETLTAVKNNNMLKVQHYDNTKLEQLKKIQKTLIRQGKYVTELKITLEDLMNVETRGRWWIVGSAFTGNLAPKIDTSNKTDTSKMVFKFDQKILDLARKHRMNTDLRKNIFCILMSAEDYIDAFEKLTKLGLKGQQYQEIIYVLMRCLVKEKKYNPYYAYIAEQFCSVDRKYQMSIQCASWDKFKEIDDMNDTQITNFAKFLSYLFVEQKLPLSTLKVLEYANLNVKMVRLLRQIILSILLCEDDNIIITVFSKISKSDNLSTLREGLQLFIDCFISKNSEKITDSNFSDKLKLLPKRIEMAENAMRGSLSYLS